MSAPLSATKQALLTIQKLQSRLDALERARTESIAIIGLSCRFPGGADDPDSYWQLLSEGRDAITEVPAERWDIDAHYDADPDAPGKSYTRSGGFLRSVDEFDAQFFGIAPREAVQLDPQQRLLLEVAWEALEHANQVPDHLLHSSTGVFAGIISMEYAARTLWSGSSATIDAYSGTGGSLSVAAGRLSYILGLTGPCMSLDTACSSSLVAVHLACQSLRLGECDLALAGGVNLMLGPEIHINFSKARMLSPDGRCKTFADSADGYGRGEGCGIIVLKRLTDALADGDRILAQIRGSAVNHDGGSGGLTVPNGPSQERVIRQALTSAGATPEQIGYIEAHGTGTALGDPIEMGALAKVFGVDRPADDPLLVGSAKTNFGHLESAAGIAGLIKIVLSMQHGEIPPHLHFDVPSSHIDWSALPVEIPTARRAWPSDGRPRLAGVSSFGFSGTNVHVVLEGAPPAEGQKKDAADRPTHTERPWHLLTLSARTPAALKELAGSYERHLSTQADIDPADFCFTANTSRSVFVHRLAVAGASSQQLRQRLVSFSSGEEAPGIACGCTSGGDAPPVAFLFTGQGSQYADMGRQLYETQPDFRRALDQCDALLRNHLDYPLLAALYPEPGAPSPLDETACTQPALFALEYALAQLWQSWGIEPTVVMGHSVGEYAAACIAGVFSLEEGLELIAARGRLMQALPGDGAMISAMADEDTVRHILQPHAESVSIAAINGPQSVVFSGAREAVQAIGAELSARDIEIRDLAVSHAFHSPLMEPMLEDFAQVAQRVSYSSPCLPMVSNLSGEIVGDELCSPDYWCRHVRQPVRFAAGMETLHQQGCELFVEIGPKVVLLGMGRRCLPESAGAWLPSLRAGREDWQQMLASLAELHVRGFAVNWSDFDRCYARNKLDLPTYSFQRQRYWIEDSEETGEFRRSPSAPRQYLHPLLGHPLQSAALTKGERVFESQLQPGQIDLLAHHRVFQQIVLPAAGHVEMALAAGAVALQAEHLAIQDFVIHQALILPEDEAKTVQLVLRPEGDGAYSFQIFSLEASADEPVWINHTSGALRKVQPESRQVDLAQVRQQCDKELSVDEYYRQVRALGIEHGERFQALEGLWRSQDRILGRLQLPEPMVAGMSEFYLHPALLDAAFQMLGIPLLQAEGGQPYLPVSLEQLRLFGRPPAFLWCVLDLQAQQDANASIIAGDLRLVGAEGEVVAEALGVRFQKVDPQALIHSAAQPFEDWLYEVQWQAKPHFGLPLGCLPAPSEIGVSLEVDVAAALPQLAFFPKLLTHLESISLAYVQRAFLQLGWECRPGERFTTAALVGQFGVIDQHRRLFEGLLQILAEENILVLREDRWEVLAALDPSDPQHQIEAALEGVGTGQLELDLLARCAGQLAPVLRGECDPLQVLFPDGDMTMLTRFYTESPVQETMNRLLQKALQKTLASLPEERGVRVLEIGAGTGGTTAFLLPHLDPERTEYTFTDVSPLFATKAQQRFAAYPFVRYQLLDIERDPLGQGFAESGYDFIIAANVLHATQDMRETLQHVRSLLAPGGVLLLAEGAARQRWLDLIFGLTEGWWRFADRDLRPDHALLSTAAWQTLLQENGFAQMEGLPSDEARRELDLPQVILVAQATDAAASPQSQNRWLILSDQRGTGQALAVQLQAVGDSCVLAFAGEIYAAVDEQTFYLDPNEPEDFQQLIRALAAEADDLRGVVHCWSLDATDEPSADGLERANLWGCGSVLHLLQALGGNLVSDAPGLWLVTRGAAPMSPGDAERKIQWSGLVQSPLWGMGKVIPLEHPELKCVRLDLDSAAPDAGAQALFAEMRSEPGEDQVALRDGRRHVPRLARYSSAVPAEKELLRSDSSYLITGGLGALGLLIAEWMVREKGVGHLVLTARSAPNQEVRARLQSIEEQGAEILLLQADVTVAAEVADMVAEIERSLPPVRGIIHAAGLLDDGVLGAQTRERFDRVMAPKVQGAWNIHQQTLNWPLDFFALFSSATALMGSSGQSNYAAANAFLDGLALYRQARGLTALSISWGAWSEIGEAALREADEWLHKRGVGSIAPNQGVQLLDRLLSQPAPQIGVVPIDWPIFSAQWSPSPFFANLRQEAAQRVEQRADLGQQLESMPADERCDYLTAHVQTHVAGVLGLESPQSVDAQQGFFDLGMDSLTSIELRNQLQDALACSLPATLLFKYPTVEKLVDYLVREILELDADADVAAPPSAAVGEVEQLSEDELAKLIDEEFEALSSRGGRGDGTA